MEVECEAIEGAGGAPLQLEFELVDVLCCFAGEDPAHVDGGFGDGFPSQAEATHGALDVGLEDRLQSRSPLRRDLRTERRLRDAREVGHVLIDPPFQFAAGRRHCVTVPRRLEGLDPRGTAPTNTQVEALAGEAQQGRVEINGVLLPCLGRSCTRRL